MPILEDILAQDLEPLILDLCEWIAKTPRPYVEVMEAWRTSCPRLTVWEDAIESGLVERTYTKRNGAMIKITEPGRLFLADHGRPV